MRRVIGETGVISNGQPPSEILMRCQAEAPVVDHDADAAPIQTVRRCLQCIDLRKDSIVVVDLAERR